MCCCFLHIDSNSGPTQFFGNVDELPSSVRTWCSGTPCTLGIWESAAMSVLLPSFAFAIDVIEALNMCSKQPLPHIGSMRSSDACPCAVDCDYILFWYAWLVV